MGNIDPFLPFLFADDVVFIGLRRYDCISVDPNRDSRATTWLSDILLTNASQFANDPMSQVAETVLC